MNFFKNIASFDPKSFVHTGLALPKKELAFSVKQMKRSPDQYLMEVALFDSLWSHSGMDQEIIWHKTLMIFKENGDNHKEFINDVILKIVSDPHMNELRISIGKHVDSRLPVLKFAYQGYVDISLKEIRKSGSYDLLHAFFYYILGYNNYGKSVTQLIYKEESLWEQSNTGHTALRDLIPQPVRSDSSGSISTKILGIPAPINPDVVM